MNIKKANIVYSVFNEHFGKQKGIKIIELLIFLAQKESLDKFKRPLINDKIYIYEGKVRIPYISDLFRVGEKLYISYRGYDITRMRDYLKLLEKYKAYTDQEIEYEVSKIIDMNNLPDKYFAYFDYNNNYRKYSRLVMNQENHSILSFVRKFFIAIPSFVVFILVLMGTYFINFSSTKVNLSVQNLLFIILIDLCLIVIYICWTLLWIKPTRFEIKNGYLNE